MSHARTRQTVLDAPNTTMTSTRLFWTTVSNLFGNYAVVALTLITILGCMLYLPSADYAVQSFEGHELTLRTGIRFDELAFRREQPDLQDYHEVNMELLPWTFGDDSRLNSGPRPTLLYPKEISQAQNINASTSTEGWFAAFKYSVQEGVVKIGDFLASLMGLDDETVGAGSGALAGFSESSVYVERTDMVHDSRPSSFGPRILTEPLRAPLYPIDVFTTSDSYGCASLEAPSVGQSKMPPKEWIALVQRGHCPFSQKVRFALRNGAVAVLFGDQSVSDGGIGGIGGLLTPWSPDDTSDVTIPSAFISRASYISLLATYDAEQNLAEEEESIPTVKPRGLTVVLSTDETFAWPLLDFLLLLLFLPSFLTLLTVFAQRVRQLQQQRLDRAPKDAVASLPVFLWGDTEKAEQNADVRVAALDEERNIGIPAHYEISQPTESTSLLHAPVSTLASPQDLANPTSSASYSRYLPSFIMTWRASHVAKNIHLAPRQPKRFQTNECAICLCDFEKGEEVMELPCGHVFHREEVEGWLLESKRLCPVCRASITADGRVANLPIQSASAFPPTPSTTVSPIITDSVVPASTSSYPSSSSTTVDEI